MSTTTLLDLMEQPDESRVYRFKSAPSTGKDIAAPVAPKKKAPATHPDIADKGNWLFCDGGVIGGNPSKHGGTWAWVHVKDGEIVAQDSGTLSPALINRDAVTNNNSELYAICRGILELPELWTGFIASDSKIALGWVCMNYKTENVPPYLMPELQAAKRWYHRSRTVKENVEGIAVRGYMNLAGHPKPADLKAQRRLSKAPHLPVSRFNVLCDRLCNKQAKQFFAELSQEAPCTK